ncbi:MAG: hypothetical protein ABFC67_10150 [Mizugakiibacter sp.]|uniref:hypothetical protein n=1 Tax=Mizugakiibacter sp. TaxID=1972610 RepID=UPI0031CA7B73|nr:hypothetical protein [Xanthomonadaceae bacterium]
MKISATALVVGSAIALAAMDMVSSVHIGIISSAHAVVGRPLTPVSYAGVARRTTRRAVAATSTHTTTVIVSTPPSTTVVAVGTVVYVLPKDCARTKIGGDSYYHCGATYYHATYQGNDLVYVVVQP